MKKHLTSYVRLKPLKIRFILGAMDGKKQGGSWGALKGFGVGLGAGIIGGTAMATAGAVTGAFLHYIVASGSNPIIIIRITICA